MIVYSLEDTHIYNHAHKIKSKFESLGSYVHSIFIIETIRYALRGIILGHVQKNIVTCFAMDLLYCLFLFYIISFYIFETHKQAITTIEQCM